MPGSIPQALVRGRGCFGAGAGADTVAEAGALLALKIAGLA